jgi:hypothetical protein
MRTTIITRTLAILAIACGVAGLAPGNSHAGTAPALLDRNLGLILPHATIQNIYWDTSWNVHQPGFTTARLDAFTVNLTTNGYLTPAQQYGVLGATFAGSHLASPLCGPTRAPSQLSHAVLAAWVMCEVSLPFTGVQQPALGLPASNSLYIVYLPANSRPSDDFTVPNFSILGHTFGGQTLFRFRSCADYLAYHTVAFFGPQLFAYAIVPAACATSIDSMTVSASHEIIEALTDPVGGGYIDDANGKETGDLCEFGPFARNQASSFAFARYWSNRAGSCMAF